MILNKSRLQINSNIIEMKHSSNSFVEFKQNK